MPMNRTAGHRRPIELKALLHRSTVFLGALLAGASLSVSSGVLPAAQAVPGPLTDIPVGADSGLGTTVPSGLAEFKAQAESATATRQTRAVDDRERAEIPDAALKREITKTLKLPPYNVLTKGDVRRLKSLHVKNQGISDLTGLELATNLELLYIDQNRVTSLEPIRGLTQLRQLTASQNPISDLSPLEEFRTLDWLELNHTNITSIEALRGTTTLLWVQLAYTDIDSLDPLRENTRLGSLYFQNTRVSDLSPLAGLDRIAVVSAPEAEIFDLEPLRGKNELELLNVNSNHITDISMLETWPRISRVGFNNQLVEGGDALIPAGATSYTRGDVVSTFSMPFGERQTIVEHATPSGDGEGAIWNSIGADEGRLEVFLSQPIVPGGPVFSATLRYTVTRADFVTNIPDPGATGTPYEFAFETTAGFTDPQHVRGVGTAGYRIASGSVPGLALDRYGVLAGTPTRAGTHTLVVEAGDRHGNVIERTFQVSIAQGTEPPAPPGTVDPPTVSPPTAAPPSAPGPRENAPARDAGPGVSGRASDQATLPATGAPASWLFGGLGVIILAAGAVALVVSNAVPGRSDDSRPHHLRQ